MVVHVGSVASEHRRLRPELDLLSAAVHVGTSHPPPSRVPGPHHIGQYTWNNRHLPNSPHGEGLNLYYIAGCLFRSSSDLPILDDLGPSHQTAVGGPLPVGHPQASNIQLRCHLQPGHRRVARPPQPSHPGQQHAGFQTAELTGLETVSYQRLPIGSVR